MKLLKDKVKFEPWENLTFAMNLLVTVKVQRQMYNEIRSPLNETVQTEVRENIKWTMRKVWRFR